MLRHARIFALSAASIGLSISAQGAYGATLQDFTSLFTAQNIAKFLPGYSAAQYADMAKTIQVDFAGNSNCLATFDIAQGANPASSQITDACGTFIDGRLVAYGLTGINWDPLQQLLGLYGVQTYAATVSPQIMSLTATRYIDSISSALNSIGNSRRQGGPARFALGDRGTGMAAGNSPSRMNGWMSGGLNETKNTFGLSSHIGVIGNLMGGVDYAYSNELTVGVSGGYDYSYIKTVFSRSVMKGSGITIAPYLSYQLDPRYSVDAVAGYSLGATDVDVKAGTTNSSGKPKYDRQFIAANLNASYWFGELQASGKLGYSYATEKVSGVESLSTADIRNTISQARLTGQVGYWMESWMPYIGVSYAYDLHRSYENAIPIGLRDKDSFSLSLGADIFSKAGWNGGIVMVSEIDRKFIRSNGITANLNRRF